MEVYVVYGYLLVFVYTDLCLHVDILVLHLIDFKFQVRDLNACVLWKFLSVFL